jgi:hypothetical protein
MVVALAQAGLNLFIAACLGASIGVDDPLDRLRIEEVDKLANSHRYVALQLLLSGSLPGRMAAASCSGVI